MCDTDQIMEELIHRMRATQESQETILKDFKTDMLLTELTYRAQKIALTLIEAQQMITMTGFLFSGGNLFGSSYCDLDGYTLTGSKDD